MLMQSTDHKKLIWDLPLRLFHWLLVLAILGSWYTSEQEGEMVDQHMQLGYFILGLITFRLVWGFAGTKHAQFKHFMPSPRSVYSYAKQFNDPSAPKYAGHNPLGSVMVVLMILSILTQAISGLFINDDIFSSGPYYDFFGSEFSKLMKTIHYYGFDVMLILIGLHLSAIYFYWWRKKMNLVAPMITGKKHAKDVREDDQIKHSKLLIALVVAVIIAAFVYWLVVINAPVIEEFYY